MIKSDPVFVIASPALNQKSVRDEFENHLPSLHDLQSAYNSIAIVIDWLSG